MEANNGLKVGVGDDRMGLLAGVLGGAREAAEARGDGDQALWGGDRLPLAALSGVPAGCCTDYP
jgi:hypothetical protein